MRRGGEKSGSTSESRTNWAVDTTRVSATPRAPDSNVGPDNRGCPRETYEVNQGMKLVTPTLEGARIRLEGHDVLRIEYYPMHLFNDHDDEKTPKAMKGKQEQKQDIDRKMNKTALVTLWVDPAEHQIVKYTFDNVWMDFLPASWLVLQSLLVKSLSAAPAGVLRTIR